MVNYRYKSEKKRVENKKIRNLPPASANDILPRVLSSYGLDSELAKYRFVDSWPEIVGAQLAQHTRPAGIRNGVLTLEVSNSCWAQELVFLRDSLIKRVQRHLSDKNLVRDIQFYVTGKSRSQKTVQDGED